MKVSYKWLQTFFDQGVLPSVEDIEHKLMFHAYEIEGIEIVNGDSVIDVDVLPNRAADSLSHRGIAREISSLFAIPMKCDPLRGKGAVELAPDTNTVEVTISDDDSCSYYVAAHIKDIKIKESPDWLIERLESIGQKSINNVVDATNYVLFDLGRPTHIFDANKLKGDVPSIGTRLANSGESITLLGGEEIELTDTMTLIIDTSSDIPLAVGGVKGGSHAEVDENTTDIIVEVANFHPIKTRLTSQALKLRTDASARFENNMADELANYGATAVVDLILEVAGGELVGYKSVGELDSGNIEVTVGLERISKLLGTEINKDEVEDIFNRLQFTHSFDGESFVVRAPFERRDIRLPEDVIEEVGRVYGYDKINSVQLDIPKESPIINKKFAYSELIRNTLAELNVMEVYLYSLRDSGDVRLINALASNKDHLRSDLSSGIIEALDNNERNMPLLGLYQSMQIFEIGNIFLKNSEQTYVCIGVRVVGKKKREERTIELLNNIKNKLEDVLGVKLPKIDNETLEFNLDEIIKDLPEIDKYPKVSTIMEGATYRVFSKYPFIIRDLAIWVPESTDEDVIKDIITKYGGELVQRIDKFDEFKKDGRVSFAFHIVFQAMDRTLTDREVGNIMKGVEVEINNIDCFDIR